MSPVETRDRPVAASRHKLILPDAPEALHHRVVFTEGLAIVLAPGRRPNGLQRWQRGLERPMPQWSRFW